MLIASCGQSNAIVKGDVEYRSGNRVLRVEAKSPTSIESGNFMECKPEGELAPEQVGPVVSFVEHTLGSPVRWISVVDGSDEASFEPVAAANYPVMAIDLRRGTGIVAVKTSKGSDYYCVTSRIERNEVIIMLDRFRANRS